MKTCTSCSIKYPDALDYCPQDGTALPGTPSTPAISFYDRLLGQTVDGRYKIESKLGEGGMGVVYAARHVIIDKRVAIKVLKKEAQEEETASQRFIQEARATSKIGHQNIVDITDFGALPDGSAYFVMEFLEGETLGQVIGAGPVPPARVISIAAQMARGLQAAHKQGVVHRDLKPENIFLTVRDGQLDVVKIVDFGIAKVQEMAGKLGGQRLTQAGMVLGTPEYMSPEQATGKDTDHRVDEYALGCMVYEMLTGEVPFRGSTSAATLTKHVFDPVMPPHKRRPDLQIPATLEAVTLKAMSKKPDDRYPGMLEFLQALDGAGKELAAGNGAGVRSDRDTLIAQRSAPRKPVAAPAGVSAELKRIPRNKIPNSVFAAIGGVALFAAAVGGVAIVNRSRGGTSGGAIATAQADVEHRKTVEVAVVHEVPAAPLVGQSVTLTIRSAPLGAEVVCDGERLGATPAVLHHDRGARPVACVLKLDGYKDTVRDLTPDGDHDVEVALLPKPKERSPSHVHSSGGGGKHPAESSGTSDLRNPFQ